MDDNAKRRTVSLSESTFPADHSTIGEDAEAELYTIEHFHETIRLFYLLFWSFIYFTYNLLFSQLDHNRELLCEAEQMNVRLEEQVKILKEEIRRLERNQERAEHINKTEYFKNISKPLSYLHYSQICPLHFGSVVNRGKYYWIKYCSSHLMIYQ